MNEDSVEKTIEIKAPRSRVWRAISNAKDFGTWFGLGTPLELVGDFVPGAKIAMTGGAPFCTIRIVEPEQQIAFDWVPYELAPGEDWAKQPTTRVEMRLEDIAGGTRLTVSESGFAKLPANKQYKRDENGKGWAGQLHSIAAHVLGAIPVRVEQHIPRSAAEMHAAIVDPEQMARYFISKGSARMEANKIVEWEWSDVGAKNEVRVREVSPERIVFLWPATGDWTQVTLALSDGKIVCTEGPFELTEDGAKRAMGQTQGWTDFCCCLKAYLLHGIDLRRA